MTLLTARCLTPFCTRTPTRGDLLFLDWGYLDGFILTHLVSSCDECADFIKEEVVRIFQVRSPATGSNPLFQGSIFQFHRAGDAGVRAVIWSNSKDRRAWQKSTRCWTLAKNGRYDDLWPRLRYVNRYDWRAWHGTDRKEKYELGELDQAFFALEPMTRLIRDRIVKDLPDDWEPEVVNALPSRSDPTR